MGDLQDLAFKPPAGGYQEGLGFSFNVAGKQDMLILTAYPQDQRGIILMVPIPALAFLKFPRRRIQDPDLRLSEGPAPAREGLKAQNFLFPNDLLQTPVDLGVYLVTIFPQLAHLEFGKNKRETV